MGEHDALRLIAASISSLNTTPRTAIDAMMTQTSEVKSWSSDMRGATRKCVTTAMLEFSRGKSWLGASRRGPLPGKVSPAE